MKRAASTHSPTGRANRDRRATWLLGIGAASGLLLASLGLLRGPETDRLPEDSVARVEDSLIRRDDYARLLAGYESDTRAPSSAEVRLHILDRMIEEELLVQRALELGLGHLDRKVRADLTSSLISAIVSEVEEMEPREGELESFHAEHIAYFTRPGRVRARQMHFRDRQGRQAPERRAAEARRRIEAGEDWQAVDVSLGDPQISPLPNSMLPLLKVREYLGPTVTSSIESLEVGAVGDPIRSGTGIHLVQLLEREAPRSPEFTAIRDQVETEWRRREGDRALRSYIDALRADASVVIDPSFELHDLEITEEDDEGGEGARDAG